MVDIVLATYNGSQYLEELLDSLCRQSYSHFRILTADDGSKDNSRECVDSYTKKLNIKRVPIAGRLGPTRAFELLLKASDAEYTMFCDQDDVWMPKKVFLSLEAIKTVHADEFTPCCAFTDLAVVDKDLNERHASFFQYQNIQLSRIRDPYYLAYRNPAPGCSMIINRAARRYSLPFPNSAIMHDWWIMLCCAFAGRITFLPQPTIKYRTHAENAMGLREEEPRGVKEYLLRYCLSPKRVFSASKVHRKQIRQAEASARRAGTRFRRHVYYMNILKYRVFRPGLRSE